MRVLGTPFNVASKKLSILCPALSASISTKVTLVFGLLVISGEGLLVIGRDYTHKLAQKTLYLAACGLLDCIAGALLLYSRGQYGLVSGCAVC